MAMGVLRAGSFVGTVAPSPSKLFRRGRHEEADAQDEALIWTPEESILELRIRYARHAVIRDVERVVPAMRAFLPRILQKRLPHVSEHILHRCVGCVVFSDASGFTQLTDKLAQRPNGSELLSNRLNKFFTPLIDIIEAYRGDVMKFSGDALTILFEATDDYNLLPCPCGSPETRKKTAEQLSCLRASACCLEIHKKLHNFEADIGDSTVRLTLHIGVGFGHTTILKVGGVRDRYEYVIAGSPMDEIAIAEGLAESGETVLSPTAWAEVQDMVIEGSPLKKKPDYHKLAALDTRLHTYPSVKQAALDCARIEKEKQPAGFSQTELKDISASFIPRAVLKHLQSGNNTSINEMRSVTIIFARIGGIDVSTDEGAKVASELMQGMQQACYDMEGSINKFLVDDKGLLFLFVFGLPPLVHIDDPQRAVAVCFDMLEVLRRMKLSGSFGLATGRVFCGIVGSHKRREYTVMGATANLAARLMAKADEEHPVLMDEATHERSRHDILCTSLGPHYVKGKSHAVAMFAPTMPTVCGQRISQMAGLSTRSSWRINPTVIKVEVRAAPKIVLQMCLPWRARSELFGGASPVLRLTRWRQLQQVRKFVNDGLLKEGGSLFMLGPTGIGKEELCECLIDQAVKERLVPIFGAMRQRRKDQWVALVQVIQNCLCILCGQDTMGNDPVPEAMVEAILEKHIPRDATDLRQACSFLGFKCGGYPTLVASISKDATLKIESATVQIACLLVKAVSELHGVVVTLRLRIGPDIHDGLGAQGATFWKLAKRLGEVSQRRAEEIRSGASRNPIVLLCMARCLPPKEVRETVPSLTDKDGLRFFELEPLTEDAAVELMCHCLGLATDHGGSLVKRRLREYVIAVSINIPLYIQECLRHLVAEKVVSVEDGECKIWKDLNSVNIAEWVQTSMVGNTMAKLEMLGSAKGHIMKLATAFEGFFTPLDLAAANLALFGRMPRSLAFFEQWKLLKACGELVQKGLLREVPSSHAHPVAWAPNSLPRWTIANSLVRKVAGSMVLNSQRLMIRRSVLIDRALTVELPKRLGRDLLADKKSKAPKSGPKAPASNQVATLEAPMTRGISLVEGGPTPDPVWACLVANGEDAADVLAAACALGNRTAVRALLMQENVVQAINEKTQVGGHTALHFACSSGELEIVQLLMLKQAQVEVKNQRSETPLLIASQRGHVEVVQYLCHHLTSGIDDIRYWERMLPEVMSEKDLLRPLMPAFKPASSHDSIAKTRKEALKLIQARLAADKIGTSRELTGDGANSYSLGQVVIDLPASREEGRFAKTSPARIASSFGLGRGNSSLNRLDEDGNESHMIGEKSTDSKSTRKNMKGSRSTQRRAASQKSCLNSARTAVRSVLRGRTVMVVMVFALLLALYVPDACVAASLTSNTWPDVVLTAVMLLFFSEVLLLCFSDTSYPFSFFFMMDCIGTISMIWDISFLLGVSATQTQQSRSVGSDEMTIFRATRTAKIGARAGRLSRLVKVLRFLPGLGTNRHRADGEKLQQISTQLTNVLSKRVAGMTILLVMLMPIFTITLYPEADLSMRVWVDSLSRRAVYSNATELVAPISRFTDFYGSKEYGPYQVCVQPEASIEEECYSLSSAPWASGFTMPERRSFIMEVEADYVRAFFDYSVPSKAEAHMGISLISLVIVLMCGACLLLNYSASELAVRPLERMLLNIKNSARVIFASTRETEGNDEDFGEALDGEVVLLERIVKKIATLAELHSKKNPFDEANLKNMKGEELGVLALTQGTGMMAADSTGLADEHQEDGVWHEPARIEITSQMQWQLEQMGIDYEDLNSWGFNALELSSELQEQLSVWLLMHNPGSCDFTEHNIDLKKLQAFVSSVAQGYQPNPYHCFLHAVDVCHGIFHYMFLMQGELLLSMLEQFSMLVAAVCHDVGHIGFNNAFLTEVQHELAVRYNDRAPLENMHCCKTFEILAQPSVNVFSHVSKEQYADVRKLIIDVILHTDIAQHNHMVKELELLYEMNSKVFQKTQVERLTDEEVELLSTSANKKLILKVLLHAADLSNPTKPWKIAEAWANRVLNEYFQQGDEEKLRGLPVGMLNDRTKVNKPSSQIGFIEFIIAPFVAVEVKIFRAWNMLSLNLALNLPKWEELWIAESSPTEEEMAKVRERIQKMLNKIDAWKFEMRRRSKRKVTAAGDASNRLGSP